MILTIRIIILNLNKQIHKFKRLFDEENYYAYQPGIKKAAKL